MHDELDVVAGDDLLLRELDDVFAQVDDVVLRDLDLLDLLLLVVADRVRRRERNRPIDERDQAVRRSADGGGRRSSR